MPEPAFLVEGLMEKRIVQRLCPGTVVQQIGCNGRDVSMATLARFISVAMRRLVNKYYPVVIIFDREERLQSSQCLIAELSQILDEIGYKDQYIAGVPDRSIENWFLPDWVSASANCGLQGDCPPGCTEGTLGKRIVK